jgi:hypothetical protein
VAKRPPEHDCGAAITQHSHVSSPLFRPGQLQQPLSASSVPEGGALDAGVCRPGCACHLDVGIITGMNARNGADQQGIHTFPHHRRVLFGRTPRTPC